LATLQVAEVLRFVFPSYKESEDSQALPARLRMYERLTGELAGRAVMSDPIPAIVDWPNGADFEVYPPSVRADLESDAPSGSSIAYVRALHERYPRSSGFAHNYALLLALSRQFAEARQTLQRGIAQAFHPDGRERCEALLKQLPA
jgi:hypothetical protein